MWREKADNKGGRYAFESIDKGYWRNLDQEARPSVEVDWIGAEQAVPGAHAGREGWRESIILRDAE